MTVLHPQTAFGSSSPGVKTFVSPYCSCDVPAFSGFLYSYRKLVERFFDKIKHDRAVATRYDKRADNFLAGAKLASIRIWTRLNKSIAQGAMHGDEEDEAEYKRLARSDRRS